MDIKKVELNKGEYTCEIDISVDEWKTILQDEALMNDNYKDALIKFHAEPGHKSTCKALGIKYSSPPQSFNATITNFAKAVQKKLNRFEITGTDGKSTYWIIPMTGKPIEEHFEWTIRPELVEAINELGFRKTINYWTFKHKPGIGGGSEAIEFVERAISINSAIMQYEYGVQNQGHVTQNWNRVKEVQEGDIIFLRGDTKIHAAGQVIQPRKKPNITLSINEILKTKSHDKYNSKDYHGCIHFNESKVFYEDLSDGKGEWGQRIDVNGWKYYDKEGIYAKDQENYMDGENEFGVLKKLKSEKANNFLNQLKSNFMGYETTLLENNKNLILTGAPGTGKTYLAKQIALKMILGKDAEKLLTDEENEIFKECHCFVQFHPSYDYTDFVEGLRPTPPDDAGNIGFERKDGVFKEFCKKALKANISNEIDNFDEAWERLLVLVKNNLAQGDLTKIGSWAYGLSTKDTLKYSSLNTPSQYSFTITKHNVYNAYQNQIARPSGAFQKDMEDVVEYMKKYLQLENYQEGAISKIKENKKYVIIIDEINRGEISKIFGELFFSIDPGYRGEGNKIQTQYSNLIENGDVFSDGFFVPENVYIIGTMNDIDRSVESFDFAMRRRFAWKEIKAIERISMWDGEIDDWKEESLKRMISINSKIETIQGLGAAFHIGPAYFLKLKNYDGNFGQLWFNHLEGVLFEYLRGLPESEKLLNELKIAYNITEASE